MVAKVRVEKKASTKTIRMRGQESTAPMPWTAIGTPQFFPVIMVLLIPS
jgi:hypothetical protein